MAWVILLEYSGDLMNQQGVFWSAAEADAQSCGKSVEDYLQGLQDKFDPYMRSGHVFDRDGLKKGMRDLITRKKTAISIVLGGKSIGKTAVLQSLANEFAQECSEVMVVYVNARRLSGSLAKGIKESLGSLNDKKYFKNIDWKKSTLINIHKC